MRIAFVIPGSGGGGVRSVVRIACGLIERGHSVRILYRHQRSDLRDLLRRMCLAVRYRRGHAWLRSFPGVALPYETLTPDRVGTNDVVIGVGISCVLEIADLPPRCGVKVHNCRGVEPWRKDDMVRAWALPMPRIVVGSHLVPLMREAGSDDPIFVAPNGVDGAAYFPAFPESFRDGVGTVYHGGDVKDPELILIVLQTLSRLRPSLPLRVFGTFPRPGRLPQTATFVRFPSLAAARELYSRSLVWFLASRNEGFGNPLVESAACGCALVSTDCGGASDIIEHGRSGLIVPVGDADAMVQSILRLLDDAALRKRFVSASEPTVDRFAWPTAIRQFESALVTIASQPSSVARQCVQSVTGEE